MVDTIYITDVAKTLSALAANARRNASLYPHRESELYAESSALMNAATVFENGAWRHLLDDGGGHTLPAPMSLNMAQLERWALCQAMRQAQGNKREAARILGISKGTVYRRLDDMDAAGVRYFQKEKRGAKQEKK